MSDTVTKLAAKLAEDVVDVQDATGESRLFIELGEVIGSASQTLEEAFMTEVRIRLAERVARKYLDAKIAELSAQATSQT
ncbi:hypothetical protein Q4555_01790 [Octadecabacter sp. 1_MG-2023]|uniref:hypothetical protein n=1 Tax=unclassified Octadecabacter TaxID=196158 RepID=UPI001C080149|nr:MULTISPECIES: hypothetical protein [unclassified Octadecabacter]MBU2993167.1 hypothetical protein [Octadecabacter sp. B2R22]MDO6733381.1 hypothetical protein [Octadecabacter sp. 1_MG-2023]